MALLFSAVTVTAGYDEAAFTVGGIPREYDDRFLAGHCDNIEAVDFSFLRPPDEYYGMKI